MYQNVIYYVISHTIIHIHLVHTMKASNWGLLIAAVCCIMNSISGTLFVQCRAARGLGA